MYYICKFSDSWSIYDGLKEAEVTKLIADISELLKEKVDHTRFMNGFSNSPQ